jgi:CRP/FNR family transcriptional regulator, cyclic AMP receptor protein
MMLTASHFSDPRLQKFLRFLSPGDFLFKQGDSGSTMFIVLKGLINVVETRDAKPVTLATLKVGETLGERALLSEAPYPRSFGAEAAEESVLMEFSGKTLKVIEAVIPDFTLRILQTTVERLDRANHLVRVLRSTDESERLVNTILYLTKFEGTHTMQGVEIKVTPDDFFRLANLSPEFTRAALDALAANKVLIPGKNGLVLTDEALLLQFGQRLRESLAA